MSPSWMVSPAARSNRRPSSPVNRSICRSRARTLSAWRVILPAAGAIAFVLWLWALAGAGAAIVGALVCILAGALMWLAHTFRI